jgi:hypothetical protein
VIVHVKQNREVAGQHDVFVNRDRRANIVRSLKAIVMTVALLQGAVNEYAVHSILLRSASAPRNVV